MIARLIDAVSSIHRASESASASLEAAGFISDDLPLIRDQAVRAIGTGDQLKAILSGEGDHDEVFVLLHQINNQLTGILSLTLLVKDELPADHPSRASLDTLDLAARHAAAVVKMLAAQLRTAA